MRWEGWKKRWRKGREDEVGLNNLTRKDSLSLSLSLSLSILLSSLLNPETILPVV